MIYSTLSLIAPRNAGDYTDLQFQMRPPPRLSLGVHSRRIHTSSILRNALPSIAHLLENTPQDPDHVTVYGRTRSIRHMKNRSFASIGDGSSVEPLQAVLTPQQAKRSVSRPESIGYATAHSAKHIHWHGITIERSMATITQSEKPKPRAARRSARGRRTS